MTDNNSRPNTKRLPKGQRKHIRRMKQEARKEAGVTVTPQPSGPVKPAQKKSDAAV